MGTILKKILILFFRVLPLRDDIILESYPDFSDNARAFYEYLLKRGVNRRHRIFWARNNRFPLEEPLPEGVSAFYLDSRGLGETFRRMSALYRSRYIFDGNHYIKKRRKGQVRVHLGHGMLIKIAPEYHNREKIGECDGYLTTGENWREVFARKVGLPEEWLLPLGYPRNDALFSETGGRGLQAPYLMWLPTYRQHQKHLEEGLPARYPYGLPEIMSDRQLRELDRTLGETGMTLYYRLHPAQETSLTKSVSSAEPVSPAMANASPAMESVDSASETAELSHIVAADDAFLKEKGILLYEMLAGSAGLLTDYSSVYYDYLLTGKPIALTLGDREEYFSRYGCAFDDVTEGVRGFQAESFEDILYFARTVSTGENPWKDELEAMKKRYHSHADGNFSKRLYEYMEKRYGWDGDGK